MVTRETVYTGVRLTADIKRRVRILAAEEGISTAVMSSRLIELGLAAYKSGAHLDAEAGQARETARAMKAARA
jgi:hypothetical protein